MKLKPYPKYKETGSEWLGSVPESWVVTPIKRVGRLKGGAGFPQQEQGFSNYEIDFHKVNSLGAASSDGLLQKSDNTISKENAQKLGAYIFPKKSIVFAKVGAALLLGRIRELAYDSCIDNNMMGFVVDENVSSVQFTKYAMNLVRFDLIANPGAVPSINESQIGNFPLVFPNKTQQSIIANFLDRETAKLDTLIAKQEKLIELLQEKRQAIISHAVTKGLEANVKMKDSGVEWLGMVPKHWQVSSLKWLSKIYSGGTPDKNNLDYWTDGTIPWINSGAVNQETITEPSEYISEDALKNSSAKWIPKDSLVMALAGQGKTKGMVAQLAIETTCNQSMAAIVLGEKCDSRFILFWLKSNYQNIRNLSGGDLRDGLNLELLGSIRCPLPPISEQIAIRENLDFHICKINLLIEKTKDSIELAKEHRTALISAAVTGKVDVREYA